MNTHDIEQIAKEVEAAFPPRPYTGAVTPADGEPFSEEIDDDLALFQHLSGRDWKSIEPEFIDFQYGALGLLTDTAFVAFFPAWLLRSLNPGYNIEAPVREHLVYTLADCLEGRRKNRLNLLNEQQRNATIKALSHVAQIDDDEPLRADIKAIQASLKSARR